MGEGEDWYLDQESHAKVSIPSLFSGPPTPRGRARTRTRPTDKFSPVELSHMAHATVIGWTMGRFTYTAIFVAPTSKWYTTATDDNTRVHPVMSSQEMADVLNNQATDNVAVAEKWRIL